MRAKIIALLIVLGFCGLLFNQSEGTNEQTVMFAKCTPDGNIQTFQKEIVCYPDESLSESIVRSCAELVAEDMEIQHYAEQQTGLFFIVSGGNGMHVALPPSGRYSRILEMYWQLIPSLVYCHYTEGGYSDISSFTGGDSMNITVPHRILCVGFVGMLGWGNTFSFSDTGFVGFTPFLWYAED